MFNTTTLDFRWLLLAAVLLPTTLFSQWEPGQVYREHHWLTPTAHNEAFLRVGGRYGYAANPGKLPDSLQLGDQLLLPGPLDLNGALRAELTLEKVMSHEDSRHLRVSVNDHAPLFFPEPASIPVPQTEYMYHTEVRVDVPLEQLTGEERLRVRLTLDSTQRWNWPQNVVYGVTLRVYYAPTTDTAPPRQASGTTAAAPAFAELPEEIAPLTYVTATVPPGTRHVDYAFEGRDVDWSGRGVPRRLHWQTHRAQPLHTVGRATATTNFSVAWNTEWLPDQEGFRLHVRALGADGKYRVGQPSRPLRLAPRPYVVRLHASGPAPRNWVTRSGEFEQTITVTDSLETLLDYRLHWVSWSPCYSNGVFLNDHLAWSRNDDCYVFATHQPVYTGHALPYLQPGKNTIRTALTPLMRGQMVHGMEVQWPGFRLKTRHRHR